MIENKYLPEKLNNISRDMVIEISGSCGCVTYILIYTCLLYQYIYVCMYGEALLLTYLRVPGELRVVNKINLCNVEFYLTRNTTEQININNQCTCTYTCHVTTL